MYDVEAIRSQFPALSRTHQGRPVAYLDAPGGSQVPAGVIEAIGGVLAAGVSNLGASFASSLLAEELTDQARKAGADLFGADGPDQIVFGQNMTSLTFAMSRALGRTWRPGDRVLVTSLDHDANVIPWRLAARDRGVSVDVARFDSGSFTLTPEAIEDRLTDRTRLVAVTHASNAIGTIPDIARIVDLVHAAGAMAFVDAVHYAPHGVIDVAESGADFLVASAYKFFGPHTGILYGARRHLEQIQAYKVRPAPDHGAGKWETGTQSFEALAGVTAAIEHLASLGQGPNRRARIVDGHARVEPHVRGLCERFLDGLEDHVALYGVGGTQRRTPTFAVNVEGWPAKEVADHLANEGVYVWAGHYYAIEVMAQLGLLDRGGAVRIGFVHTTTEGEVDRVLELLNGLRPRKL